MKRFLVSILVILLLFSFPVSAAERKLTLDRAVLINEKQIILEFSEPIAINLEDTNYGPFIAVRVVNSSGGLVNVTDKKSVYYGDKLQWTGTYQYVDSKHDRLVWTMNNTVNTVGLSKLSDILAFKGELANYTKNHVALQLEEVPYDATKMPTDFKICNVTTRDGEVHLSPTVPNKWEKCNMPIIVDFGYKVDLSATESTKETITYDYSLIDRVTGAVEETPIVEIETVMVKKNDPIITAGILGGGALLGVVLLLVLVMGKRKAVSK